MNLPNHTLPAYRSTIRCRACGYYEMGGAEFDTEYVNVPALCAGGGRSADVTEEALLRTCPRCGYKWAEALAEPLK